MGLLKVFKLIFIYFFSFWSLGDTLNIDVEKKLLSTGQFEERFRINVIGRKEEQLDKTHI